jgi:hypothetical protein
LSPPPPPQRPALRAAEGLDGRTTKVTTPSVTANAAGAVPDANFLTFDIRENRPHRVSPDVRPQAPDRDRHAQGRLRTMTTGWR